jgi:magnesium transporter
MPPPLVHARTRSRETSRARVGPHALRASPADSAADVRSRLSAGPHEPWDLLCVVDAHGCLLGTMTPQRLASMRDDERVGHAMTTGGPCVTDELDQEALANHALHHGVAAMPVVDARRRLVGVVGPTALMRVLRREHVEDLHRLAGIARETEQAREAIESPPLRRARHRLPWLLAGLAGSAIATFVVSRYEQTLEARPALAFFVPGLVYLADAIGTQTEAIAVRGLSLSRIGVGQLASGELRTGALIGAVLAAIAFPAIWLAFGDPRLAFAVCAALACASAVASVLGLALPWVLSRLGADPAYGSGPLATIVQDVLSLLIYFAFVSAVVV